MLENVGQRKDVARPTVEATQAAILLANSKKNNGVKNNGVRYLIYDICSVKLVEK